MKKFEHKKTKIPTEMYLKQIIKTKTMFIFILFNTVAKGINGETFHNNSKSLEIITGKQLKMDCFHLYIYNLNPVVFDSIFKLDIPLSISTKSNIDFACQNSIVQINNIENLILALENFATYKGFLFIIINNTKINWKRIAVLAEQYWKLKQIYKVFYITTQHSKFFHPFLYKNYKNGALIDSDKYDINKIFNNFYGYPMKIYIFDSVFSEVKKNRDTFKITKATGVDAKVAYLLEYAFNFTMELQWPDDNFFGARLENGTFNGALGRMIRKEADLTLAGFFVKDYLTSDVVFSVSVYMDKLCCYVIKSKRIPPSILPLYAVNENVWLAYMTVGFFSSIIWMLLRRLNLYTYSCSIKQIAFKKPLLKSHTYYQYLNIFTDTWVLWLRMTIARFPPYNTERIFTISLCLVSVIIGALLESSLATVYIRPRYYKDINTLEELEKANLRIFIKHAAMRDDLFQGQNSWLYKSLDKRVMLVGESEERLISIMSKRGGFAAVTREYSLLTVDIYYFITKKIHIIPECPKIYHIAYVYSKNSPYEEIFNIALLKFLSAGLINHWIDETRHEAQYRIHNFKEFIAESSHQWKVFQINDLQLAFYILITGHFFASLLFIGEFIVHKK